MAWREAKPPEAYTLFVPHGNDDPEHCEGNPVDVTTGAKLQRETDLRLPGGMAFERFYRSLPGGEGPLEGGWRHSFERSLTVIQGGDGGSSDGVEGIDLANGVRTSEYPTPEQACVQGWAEIRGKVRQPWAPTASASFEGDRCRLRAGGEVVFEAEGSLLRSDQEARSESIIQLTRPNGSALTFFPGDDGWEALRPGVGSLESAEDGGWRFSGNDQVVEHYADDGRLQAVRDHSGRTLVDLSYDAGTQRLGQVETDQGGRLAFDYHDGDLIGVTTAEGNRYRYAHDDNGRLTEATRPATNGGVTTRTYHYEDPAHPQALTGISDNAIRHATWAYDERGRAVSSERAHGAGRTEFRYTDSTTTTTNPLGRETTYHLEDNPGGRRVEEVQGLATEHCAAAGRERDYTERGFVASETDWEGNTTTYAYNDRGLVTERTEAAGTPQERTVTTRWHPDYRLPIRIAEPRRRTELSHDDHGRLAERTVTDTSSGVSRTWRYSYHPGSADITGRVVPGRLARVTGPRGDIDQTTEFAYDAEGRLIRVTNALGHVTEITGHDPSGRPIRLEDPNGVVIELTYDPRGRLASQAVAGARTRFAYDGPGNLTRITRPDGTALMYEYDAAHRLIAMADGAGNRIDYTLDAAGNRTEQRVTAASGAVAREHRQVFDELGNLIRTIGAQGQTTHHQYDANANRTETTDPTGASTHRAFDALGRLARQSDALGGVTAFAHDSRDRITAVTDPNGYTTHYTWNGFGERTRVDSPDAGTTTYAYNAAGDLIEETDARGQTTRYTRDALGRPLEMTTADGRVTTFTWDEGEHGIGRLARIDEDSGTTAWVYNAHGDVIEKTQTADDVTLTTRHEYDPAGRRTATVYPSGTRVTYEYDAGRITGLAVDGEAVLTDIGHEPFGPVNGWTWGDGAAHARDYDRDGRLTAHSMPEGQRQLGYTADGQVDAITGTDTIRTHDYDALKRLARTDATEGSWAYDYDANGNRLSRREDGETTTHTHAADSNRLESVRGAMEAAYTYTAAGHMTGDGTHTYQYGPRGRLTRVDDGDTAIYGYNALGQRIVKRAATGDAPDYIARAEAAEAAAQALRDEADNLDDQSAEARQTAADAQDKAARARDERDQYQAEVQHHAGNAERQRHRARQWQQRADAYQAQADTYRERLTDRPRTWWQYLDNVLYRALADIHTRIAERFRSRADQATVAAEQADEGARAATARAEAAEERLHTARAEAESQAQRAEDLQQQAQESREAAAEQEQQAEEYRRLAEATDTPGATTTRFVYGPEDRLLGRYAEDGTPVREYIRLGTTPVAAIDANGTIHYIHTDHLGTPRAVSQPDGDVVWRWIASPFGKGAPDEDANGDGRTFTFNLRFPGQYFDAETGRHYNYFRDYDPAIGRYTTPDPIGLAGGDVNLYAYVINDPINMVDPDGLRGRLTQSYVKAQGTALVQYFRIWIEAAVLAGGAVAGGPAVGAAVRAPTAVNRVCQAAVSRVPARYQSWYFRNADRVNDALMGGVSEAGAPPATAAGASGAAGRLIYDVQVRQND